MVWLRGLELTYKTTDGKVANELIRVSPGCLHPATATRSARLFSPESLENAPIFRNLSRPSNSLITDERIAVDLQPAHYKQVEESRGARILPANSRSATMVYPRACRQIDAGLFERAVVHPPQMSAALQEQHPGAQHVFRDAYLVEFLDLPANHLEADANAR